jgi:integrase
MPAGPARRGHSGYTGAGHVRDVRVQRVGRVTVYKRGHAYYLYYRERGESVRRRVEGNLASARAAASHVAAAIEEHRPSPFSFSPVAIPSLLEEFVDHCEKVRGLSFHTVDRYRAALAHFKDFALEELPSSTADEVTEGTVEDFVRWLRGRSRARNGAEKGQLRPYMPAGIKFILSACRTAFSWAAKRRYLPPYAGNPFSSFPIESIGNREQREAEMLTPEDQAAFVRACDAWQRPIFLTLLIYGLRVGELTHLLVSDVDFEAGALLIRSKPEMLWHVKTQHERVLPIPAKVQAFLERLRGGRKAGFLFLNREFAEGKARTCESFPTPQSFRARLEEIAEQARREGRDSEKEILRAMQPFLRAMGQIPEKRVRQEFVNVTKKIGCPAITRVHSLRHLFTTRAQENGVNPFLIQGILGHSTLDMTRRYTHFGLEATRQAVSHMIAASPVLEQLVRDPSQCSEVKERGEAECLSVSSVPP